MESNPNALLTLSENVIFTNVAIKPDGDVWWEGMTKTPPPRLSSWLRREWTPASPDKAAHPNSRFTVPASQCPVIDPAWEDPKGVPIDAIVFGGRRSSTMPLVFQAFDWKHGTFLGAMMASETTAAAEAKTGVLRPDPFAMKPFCGYNISDYFAHWFSMEARSANANNLPKMFHVNWFRKNADGKFMWPGFGDNARVLKWIVERATGDTNAKMQKTPIGLLPTADALDLSGLSVTRETMSELLAVNKAEWLEECKSYDEFIASLAGEAPAPLVHQLKELKTRLQQN